MFSGHFEDTINQKFPRCREIILYKYILQSFSGPTAVKNWFKSSQNGWLKWFISGPKTKNFPTGVRYSYINTYSKVFLASQQSKSDLNSQNGCFSGPKNEKNTKNFLASQQLKIC